MYYTIYCESPGFDFINNSSYFQNAHILSKLNMDNCSVEQVIGYYPDIYTKDASLKQFSIVHFDVDKKGNFFLSFEADSLIYEYDYDYRPIKAYGYAGKNMDRKAVTFSTIKDFQLGHVKNREEQGFYNNLIYVDETNLLFRSYQKGKKVNKDGLQIYKNGILLGDVEVPKGLKIVGYIAPFYYASTIINDEEEDIKMYKFTIEL